MAQPLKLTVDKTEVTSNDTFTTTVEAFNGTSWTPLSDATLYIDPPDPQYATDADGEVKSISPAVGTYTLYADKGTYAEYIRSNRKAVTVSEVPASIPGDVNGDGYLNALDITKVERIIAGLD